MKQINFKSMVLMLALAFGTMAFGNELFMQGESNGYAGTYKVYSTTQANTNQWILNYGAGEMPVTIAIAEIRGEKVYHVYSASFEVMFVNSKKGFGMRKVSNGISKVDARLQSLIVNEEKIQSLKVISTETPSVKEALSMIATYLPEVINENYHQLLN